MPTSCSAINCVERATSTSVLTFHRFPKDTNRREAWVRAMRRKDSNGKLWQPSITAALCSLHFKDEMFDKTGQYVKLRPNAVPTEFYFPSRMLCKPRKERRKIVRDVPMVPLIEREQEMPPVIDLDLLNKCKPRKERRKIVRDVPMVPVIEKEQEMPPGIDLDLLNKCKSRKERRTKVRDVSMVPVIEREQVRPPVIDLDLLNKEHQYCLPPIEVLRDKLRAAEQNRDDLRKQIRNSGYRERRARHTCHSVTAKLEELHLITDKLKIKLDSFSDSPIELFAKPLDGYSSSQREFASTLYRHSSKAYKYLRDKMNIPLPHPRTLRGWRKN